MKKLVLIAAFAIVLVGGISLYLWTLGLTPVRTGSVVISDAQVTVRQSRHVPLARILDFSWRTTWEISKEGKAGRVVLYATDKASVSDRAEVGTMVNGRYFLRITDAANRVVTSITFMP